MNKPNTDPLMVVNDNESLLDDPLQIDEIISAKEQEIRYLKDLKKQSLMRTSQYSQ